MLHAEPFETKLLSAELCILFIYFLKGNCIGLEYHIILSKIHIIVIIKTKIIDKNKSCSNTLMCFVPLLARWFTSHLPRSVLKNEQRMQWSHRIMSLSH